MKIDKNARYAVIGYGSWATAIAGLLTQTGTEIGWFVRNPEVLESLQTEGHNAKYLNELEFDRNLIHPCDDINEVVANADVLVVSVPSAFLKSFFESLTVSLEDKFIVSAVKGIIPGNYQTVTEFFRDEYSVPYSHMGLITGPSHAEEVSRGRLSYLTIVSTSLENARLIGERLHTKYIHLSYSQDIYGTEYAAILKNIYALAAGLAHGLGYGDNFLSVLVANCADEMTRFLDESYPDKRDTFSSAYLGDLLVTCYSPYSRNRRLGALIGHGCTVKSALNEMTMIAEGYYAVECIRHINFKHKVDMPIADMVYDVLYNKVSPRKRMKALCELLH